MRNILASLTSDTRRYPVLKRIMAASTMALGALAVSLGLAAPAFADGNGAVTGDFPIAFPLVSPCNGDVVALTGTVHFELNIVNNKNTAHAVGPAPALLHDTLHVSGIAADGTRYVANGGDVQNVNMSLSPGGTSTDSLLRHIIFISQGSDPNFAFSLQAHITVNANGVMAASFAHVDPLECIA